MKDDLGTFGKLTFASIFGAAVAIKILANFGTMAEADAKISECQKDLPRSQTCVLIAIPKQETIQEK